VAVLHDQEALSGLDALGLALGVFTAVVIAGGGVCVEELDAVGEPESAVAIVSDALCLLERVFEVLAAGDVYWGVVEELGSVFDLVAVFEEAASGCTRKFQLFCGLDEKLVARSWISWLNSK